MKTTTLLALIAAAATLTFSSCSKDNEKPNPGGDTEETFVDAKFVAVLAAAPYNVPLTDGKIDPADPATLAVLKGITKLDVSEKEITSVQGIEYMTELTEFDCHNNKLAKLDISRNTKLISLNCSDNALTLLDVKAHTALTKLVCNNNALTSLDVRANRALTDLQCLGNVLSSIDLSANTALTYLNCADNSLTSLDLQANTALTGLVCNNNALTSLDVQANRVLVDYLYCGAQKDNRTLTLTLTPSQEAGVWKDCKDEPRNANVKLDVKDDVPFSDPAFVAVLAAAPYNVPLTDGKIDPANAATLAALKGITSLDLFNKGIVSVKGIEYMTELTDFSCENNKIGSLDVSKNTKLTDLNCGVNALTSLDVSANTALIELNCNQNFKLSALDVRTNTALTILECFNNTLSSLDVSANRALTSLNCADNALTSLDVSTNTALTVLACGVQKDNRTLTLTLTRSQEAGVWQKHKNLFENANVELEYPPFNDANFVAVLAAAPYSVPLTDGKLDPANAATLAALKAITNLNVSDKEIVSVRGVEYMTELADFNCYKNKLAKLDISRNTKLTSLNCAVNALTKLDISQNTKLTYLNCAVNSLTSLDVQANTALTYLACPENALTSLDVRANKALTNLQCHANKLTSLDVQANTALTYLACPENALTSLDVRANRALTDLICADNALTSLDVSANTALGGLTCDGNKLSSLDVRANTALITLYCGIQQNDGRITLILTALQEKGVWQDNKNDEVNLRVDLDVK